MYKVILVDDEKYGLIDLEKTVPWTEYGFEVINSYKDSKVALNQILTLKPDVVFTDIKMPFFSGIELIQESKKLGYNGEFVIISGYADFYYAQEALKNSVFDYLLKPLDSNTASTLLFKLQNKLNKKSIVEKNINLPPITNNKKLNDIISFIDTNIQISLSVEEICNKFFISTTSLCTLFKKELNTTYVKYLTKRKIEFSLRLLRDSDLTISEIANCVGYHSYFYFSKTFKKIIGTTPSEYREDKKSYEK